jgi:hypothetical protein
MGALLNQQYFASDSRRISIKDDLPFFREYNFYIFHGRIIAANGIFFKLDFEPTATARELTERRVSSSLRSNEFTGT